MARIDGVQASQAGPVVKLVYRFGPRAMKKLTGRDRAAPASSRSRSGPTSRS